MGNIDICIISDVPSWQKKKRIGNGDGGVGIYISNRTNFRTKDDSNSEEGLCESVFLEIILKM